MAAVEMIVDMMAQGQHAVMEVMAPMLHCDIPMHFVPPFFTGIRARYIDKRWKFSAWISGISHRVGGEGG